MAREETETKKDATAGRSAVARVRAALAHVVWLACATCATVLAVGALLVALGANRDNALVDAVLRAADSVDLGVFSREDGIKQFSGQGAQVKNALVNWGLGALAWLLVGRLLDRILRP